MCGGGGKGTLFRESSQTNNKKADAGSHHAMARKTPPPPPGTRHDGAETCAGSQACQPIATQAAFGKNLPTDTPTATISKQTATITQTPPTNNANRTARQAAAPQTRLTAKSCGREVCRPTGQAIAPFSATKPFSGAFQRSTCSSITGCVCVHVCCGTPPRHTVTRRLARGW